MSLIMRNLQKGFGDPVTPVLRGISSEIRDGEVVAITGRSGSGKSTLLYIISSLDKASAGEVEIDGKVLANLGVHDLHRFRNERMGFVFQFHHLLPELTALENVLMPARKSRQEKIIEPRALELLGEFGLRNKADRLPSQLSGGEQQRVAIARALVMEPKYLFADEPTGNLDSANAEAVMRFFLRINKERGTTVVFVTHDPLFARMAPRQIILVDGIVDQDLLQNSI